MLSLSGSVAYDDDQFCASPDCLDYVSITFDVGSIVEVLRHKLDDMGFSLALFHAAKEVQQKQEQKASASGKRKLPTDDRMWWQHPVRKNEWWYYYEKAGQMRRYREPGEENISMHGEGGHYTQALGSRSNFVDRDCEVASGVALAEAQDGAGSPLFHRDGSLLAPWWEEEVKEEPSIAAASASSSAAPVKHQPAPQTESADSGDEGQWICDTHW